MKNTSSGRSVPQLYILSEEGYDNLKHIQDMLALMAQITYNTGDSENGGMMLSISRIELCFIFETINARINEVVERLGNENWLGTQRQTWH